MVVVSELERGRKWWQGPVYVAAVYGGCWWCVWTLQVRFRGSTSWVALFFQDEGPSMGGERNKRHLSPRLAVFQILEKQRLGGLFSFDFWYFWVFLGSKTLCMDG